MKKTPYPPARTASVVRHANGYSAAPESVTVAPSSIWRSPYIISAGILFVLAFVLLPWWESRILRVNHVSGDDHSASASGLTTERQDHCLAASNRYKSGDRRFQVDFSEIAETVNETVIENSFLFNACDGIEQSTADIGHTHGTSLIHLVEHIHHLSHSAHLSDDRPIVVTLTIHAAEPGPAQPALDSEGFDHLRTLLTDIGNQGAIAIIGPGGTLQNQLQQELHTVPNLRIAPFAATQDAVDWAFATARGRRGGGRRAED